MARRRSRSRGYSSRRSFSRGSRRNTGRSFRGRSARGRARANVVRLVIEQPGSNPIQRPGVPGLIGLAQDNTQPRKKMF